MREPTLRDTTIISLCLHIILFGLTLLTLKKSTYLLLPEPYTVRLVSPDRLTGGSGISSRAQKIKAIKREQRKRMKVKKHIPPPPAKKTVKKTVQPRRGISVEEQINLIKAKKRIEKIVKLRKAVLSIQGEAEAGKPDSQGKAEDHPSQAVNSSGGDSLLAGYHALVKERIWNEWVYPSLGDREDLECIVTITIEKDGKVVVKGIDRSSGNRLFDRSALRAIEKASPLPPPPYRMTIGLRFTP
jgi:colicin import membrane protein